MQLTRVVARKILNSRREATIEVITESGGLKAAASAPSGASKGRNEVKDISSRGIDFSISFINVLGKKLVDEKIIFERFEDLEKLEAIVKAQDHTKNLEFIGGNALYAIEAAIVKLMALSKKQETWQFLSDGKKPIIPRPIGNCIGGGMHTKLPIKTDFQEFLLIPKTARFFDACFINLQAYKEIREILQKRDEKWKGSLTDENAFASALDNESVLELLNEVKEKIKIKFEMDIEIGIDVAASSFFKAGKYHYGNFSRIEKEKILRREEQIEYISGLIKKYRIAYIEDPIQSEDFEGFAKIKAGTKALICGDDLTCTHPELLEKAARIGSISAAIIKPNQIGSLLETKKAADTAKKNNIVPVISHRSGETEDDFIADLAIAWQIPFIKAGIIGKEREAKLNRIVKIEKETA
ncbi:MAG: enolase C-terminal domain-like protein [Candidatus Paceibacterota bacterium]